MDKSLDQKSEGGANDTGWKAPKVDPSVRLGPLTGPIVGEVPMERTMKKPQAYKQKQGT